ncbi:hypothetical protein ACHAPT_006915 [Fusarium lateritium]
MRFSLGFVLLGAASVTNALLSPGQLIRNIEDLTESTLDLIQPAKQLSDVITGLRDVTRSTTDITGSLSGAAKGTFDGKDADKIVASLEKLSTTFSNLLDAFLAKIDIFGDIPIVGTPFRVAIALTKRAFDEFSGSIISSLSGKQANDARSSVQRVDGKFTRTITITTTTEN